MRLIAVKFTTLIKAGARVALRGLPKYAGGWVGVSKGWPEGSETSRERIPLQLAGRRERVVGSVQRCFADP